MLALRSARIIPLEEYATIVPQIFSAADIQLYLHRESDQWPQVGHRSVRDREEQRGNAHCYPERKKRGRQRRLQRSRQLTDRGPAC